MRQKIQKTKNITHIKLTPVERIHTSYYNITLKTKNDINFNIDTLTKICNQTHTAHKESTFHTKTIIMGNNGSVSNNKNFIVSASRNHNQKKEYRMMNPIPIKDKMTREHVSQIKISNVIKNQYQHQMPIQTNQIKTKI